MGRKKKSYRLAAKIITLIAYEATRDERLDSAGKTPPAAAAYGKKRLSDGKGSEGSTTTTTT